MKELNQYRKQSVKEHIKSEELKKSEKYKNTESNKRVFFAQYWDQMILYNKIDSSYTEIINGVNSYDWSTCIIKLKSLSSLTDEEIIHTAFLVGKDFIKKENCEISRSILGINCVDKKSNYGININFHQRANIARGFTGIQFQYVGSNYVKYERGDIISGTDYLRSLGYALPWSGITVEELIEFGWIILEE